MALLLMFPPLVGTMEQGLDSYPRNAAFPGKTAASDECWAKTGFRVKDERKVAILLKVKVGMSICWRF